MLTIVLLVTSLAFDGIDAALSPCDFRRTDDCYKNAIALSQAGILPGSEESINEACQTFLDVFDCLENFIKKCLTPALREVNMMLAAKPRQILKQACIQSSDTEIQNLGNASCVQKALAEDDMKSHTEVFLDAMEISELSKQDQKMPIFCCAVENLFQITVKKLNTVCGKSETEEGNSWPDLPVSKLRDMSCRGSDAEPLKCAAIHSSSRRRQYGDLRIVKSMSSFMEILITETFEI